MTVKEASFELFMQLRDNNEVVGTGVRNNEGESYIIVYLTKAKRHLLNKIPHEFHGNLVKTEISSRFSI